MCLSAPPGFGQEDKRVPPVAMAPCLLRNRRAALIRLKHSPPHKSVKHRIEKSGPDLGCAWGHEDERSKQGPVGTGHVERYPPESNSVLDYCQHAVPL